MNEDTSFEEFMGALDDSTDYQIDSESEATVEEPAEIDQQEDEASAEEENETPADESKAEEAEKKEDATPSEKPADAETFTLKVNKEEKTYSREEVISLAQKGADYDRVKEQLNQSRQANQELQSTLDSQKEAMAVLSALAEATGTDVPKLLDDLRIGALRKQGLSDDVARERIARDKVERENAELKAAAEKQQETETSAQRAEREIAEFRSEYPGTQITQELVDKLMNDVQNGMSLTQAYRKYEAAQKDERIAQLEAQLAAEKQNRDNRTSSPGSQRDSGGRNTKNDFDDFMDALS